MGSHGHQLHIEQEQFKIPAKAKTFALGMLIIGLILSIIGIVTVPKDHISVDHGAAKKAAHKEAVSNHGESEKHAEASSSGHGKEEHSIHPQNVNTEEFGPRASYEVQNKPWTTRIWANLLIAGYFFTIISLAALFFIAVQYIANAGWSAAIKRVPEAIMTFFPVAFVVLLAVLFIAKDDIYHWAHYEHGHFKKGDAGYDKILAGKSGFLNSGMLLIFPTILITVWFLIGRKLRSLSLQEDGSHFGETKFFKQSIRWSAGFAVLYGFTISIVAWLVIMSIDSHWYSTIFGVYNFATGWVTSLTVICCFVIYLKSQGYLKIVSDEHVHDLGKFMFAFSVFWTYIWLSQYLLIWYAHIPEEMYYYQIRYEQYYPNFITNVIMNFACPFLILMMRNAKRNRIVLTVISVILILGHYHDIWLMVFPGVFGPGMQIGLLEIGFFLFFGGLFTYWVLVALTKRGLIAINHPYIQESAHHDVGV